MRQLRAPASAQRAQVDQLLDFSELVEGDFVVHLQHGIALYRGLSKLDTAQGIREVITLEFDDHVTLHVPLQESHLISRYVGLSKTKPQLGRIGSGRWEKARQAAERSTIDLAAESFGGLGDEIVALVALGDVARHADGLAAAFWPDIRQKCVVFAGGKGARQLAAAILAGNFGDARAELAAMLLRRLDAVLSVRASKLVLFQAARDAVPGLLKLLPDAEPPTVMAIEGQRDQVALQALCRSAMTWQRLEDMKRAGASGLLVLPVEQMLA